MAQGDFVVVRNDEEQYSIWPAGQRRPPGWYAVGVTGDQETCLAHIDQVWTDMRPASLRWALTGGPVGRG
jgi:MbtH protein